MNTAWKWATAALAALGVVALAKQAGAAPMLPIPTGAGCHDNPFRWARGNLSKMTHWWNGDVWRSGHWVVGDAVGPTTKAFAATVFPGVPPAAFLGFMANGSLYGSIAENTIEGVPTQRFGEGGPFGTELGPREGPQPNPDPNAHNNSWTPLASNATVVSLLGRSAVMGHNAWKTSWPDQCAVGLVNIRAAGRSMNARLSPAARATSESSLWFIACAFMGWSAGVGGASSHINRVAGSLAGVPDDQKWGVFLRAMRAAIQSGDVSTSTGKHHTNAAYSVNRTWQKLAAGQLLASTVSGAGDPRWFNTGLGEQEADFANYFCQKSGSA